MFRSARFSMKSNSIKLPSINKGGDSQTQFQSNEYKYTNHIYFKFRYSVHVFKSIGRSFYKKSKLYARSTHDQNWQPNISLRGSIMWNALNEGIQMTEKKTQILVVDKMS